jgi:translation initiation factor IF-3
MIRVGQVRVVDEEGNQLGVMPTPQALQLAQERGLDLVEVAPMASPPVTRLLDYGQFKYEQARKEKEARRHQRSVEFKEIRLKVKIGKGDFDTKVRRAIRFLEDGDRVKVTVQFRGREVSHAYIGRDLLTRFAERVAEHGSVERLPILEGRSMSMVVSSSHKPKVSPPPAREGSQAEDRPAAEGNGAAPESEGPSPEGDGTAPPGDGPGARAAVTPPQARTAPPPPADTKTPPPAPRSDAQPAASTGG